MEMTVWRCAGHIGIDPRPFTLRQLLVMASASWEPAADILKMLYDVHRDQKHSQNLSTRWFNRYTRKVRPVRKSSVESITEFGKAFAQAAKEM